MGRSSSSKRGGDGDGDGEEWRQRKRLKTLAFHHQLLSHAPARCLSPPTPSKQVLKHHGKDILRKSQRKNRFLFSFPALLAPISGASIGDLDCLSSKNPVLYLHFAQGRLKLFGTIVYPKNRYLTLQFSRGGKNVVCDDYFDTMIVFSEAWWIGTKEDNPEEARLEFPEELAEGQQTEFDFRGGAGAVSAKAIAPRETGNTESPEADLVDGLSDDGESQEDKIQATPVRQSQRNAGKKFNFAETSPVDASGGSDSNTSKEVNEELLMKADCLTGGNEEFQAFGAPVNKVHAKHLSSSAARKAKSTSSDGSLVQATLSSLFKKAEEKANGNSKKKSSFKA